MFTVEGSRRRAATFLAAATTLILGVGAVSASAQLGLPGQAPSTTTTAAPSSTSSTTQAPTSTTQPTLLPRPAPTTTTTAPPARQEPQRPLPPGEGDGAPPADAGAMPPELQAMVNSVVRTPAGNTRKLLAALQPLEQYGLDATKRAVVGFGRFPIAGEAVWSDDWWFPRFGPGWRLHQGIDIFAAHGTPVRAPVDGSIRVRNGGLGGLSVYVTQPDGTYWYLAHLAGLGPGIVEGATVTTGQVVGFVGDSGNARGGKPHLHMEIHPQGGAAIPPKPVVDRFVADALALVPQLLDAYAKAYQQGQAPPQVVAAPTPELVTLTPRKALLWATAANPAGGTLRLVENDALALVTKIDWDAEAAATAERAAVRAWVQGYLRPLAHPALAAVLYDD